MFNLLVLGFCCNVYKNKPNIRVFFNEKFIDEYNIEPSDNINKETTPKLKIYKLDIPLWPLNNFIKLDIKNSDSNYNNGFMTKSTLIKFHTFLFISIDKTNYESIIKLLSNVIPYNFNAFNLIPYTTWTNENNNITKNVSDLTIGGSGTFKCDLFRDVNVFRPINTINNTYNKYGRDITKNVLPKQ